MYPLVHHPPPSIAISHLANSLKHVLARNLRRNFTSHVNQASIHGHFWPPPYLAPSRGRTALSITRQYIEQQRQPFGQT